MADERDPSLVLGVRRSAAWPEIRAAYRALARRYHADGTNPDLDRMVEINTAYARLERERNEIGDAPAVRQTPAVVAAAPSPAPAPVPVGPGWAAPIPPPSGSLLGRMAAARVADSPVVDFGQYAGWRIADIARCDPRYLRWLSRHSSGHRYRAAIAQVLGPDAEIGRRAALIG